MGRHRKAASLALATAVIGVVLSPMKRVIELEDKLGLGWSFQVRDLVKPPLPPSNVVIVNADGSDRLALPSKVTQWPRAIHGQLVDRLVAALMAQGLDTELLFAALAKTGMRLSEKDIKSRSSTHG